MKTFWLKISVLSVLTVAVVITAAVFYTAKTKPAAKTEPATETRQTTESKETQQVQAQTHKQLQDSPGVRSGTRRYSRQPSGPYATIAGTRTSIESSSESTHQLRQPEPGVVFRGRLVDTEATGGMAGT